jgi:hypothetical protein
MPGTGSVRAEQEKPLPYSHLPPIRNAISDPASAGETPPKAAHRFCRRIRPADDVFGTHSVPLVGGCPIATPASRRLVPVHHNRPLLF